MKTPLNVIGTKLRHLREQQGLTQDQLAAKCQVLGLDITRGTLAKIESEIRAVFDHEIPFIAQALNTGIESLYPKKPKALPRRFRNPSGTTKKLK